MRNGDDPVGQEPRCYSHGGTNGAMIISSADREGGMPRLYYRRNTREPPRNTRAEAGVRVEDMRADATDLSPKLQNRKNIKRTICTTVDLDIFHAKILKMRT
jgi:hypothetical protein